MPKKKFITISEAHAVCKKHAVPISRPTIIKYIKRFELGHQVGEKGGKWAVHAEKWRRFVDGKIEITRKVYDSESVPTDRGQDIQEQFQKIV